MLKTTADTMSDNITVEIAKIPFDQVPQFSKRDQAYVAEETALRPFYQYEVNIESFAQVIADKQTDKTNRTTLVEVLHEQYSRFSPSEAVSHNIDQLNSEKTFTVITAHQPSLFTGPLYYIYKIISAINLAKTINAANPDYYVVPVFVTGGEDHDFEEVNHVNLFNKNIVWENEEKGSVGMMKTASLSAALEELKSILGDSENATRIFNLIEKSHTLHNTYSDAVIELVHELFKADGLVVLNMNHAKLKKIYAPTIHEEIFHQPSKALVEATSHDLEAAGYKQQAHPREINFFYLRDQVRERIVQEGDRFTVLNTDYSFSKEEMEAEITQHPEHFSPNVVMRPIFQELIFPNLAYIGGGGEIAYWLERKSQFAHFGINFPMLVRRDSVMWIDKGTSKKMKKLSLDLDALLQDEDTIIREYISQQAESSLSLGKQKAQLTQIFQEIKVTAAAVDPSLGKTVMAEHAKQIKAIEQLEGRLVRAEKQRHETAIKQIRGLKQKLFPNNGLQERHDNFLGFYLKHGEAYFDILKANLDPLAKKMTVVVE